MTTRSLKELLLFPFRGPDWRSRFLIGAALVLAGHVVPIVPLVFVAGYVLQVMRQAALGEDMALPVWDDWGCFGLDGLRAMAVGLIYLLPGLAVLLVGMGVYFAAIFAMPGVYESNMIAVGPDSAWPLTFMGGVGVMLLSMCLGTLLLALGAVPLPAALAHFSVRDQFGAAFRPREWWPLVRANAAGYFAVWVVGAGLAALLYIAQILLGYSVILCCVTPFVSAAGGFYLSLVGAALFGQFYRESTETPVAEETTPSLGEVAPSA